MKKRVSLQQSTPKTNISKCRVVDILYLLSCFISKYSCLRSHELLHCVVLVGLWRDKGSRQLLFLRNSNFITMPKTDEFRVKSNNSTLTSTSGNTKVAISPFNIKNISSFLEKRKCVVSLQRYTYRKAEMSANILWAFFMSTTKHIRFHAPVSMVNALTAFRCIATGQRETVFFLRNDFINKRFN